MLAATAIFKIKPLIYFRFFSNADLMITENKYTVNTIIKAAIINSVNENLALEVKKDIAPANTGYIFKA